MCNCNYESVKYLKVQYAKFECKTAKNQLILCTEGKDITVFTL